MYIGDYVQIGTGAYFYTDTNDARIEVGNYAVLGDMVTIRSHRAVSIGHHAKLGNNLVIDNATEYGHVAPVKIGAYAIFEDDVTVLGGVTVGNSSKVIAGSVVKENLPAYCVAGGNPARILSLYDVRKNNWHKDPDAMSIEDILRARKERPLLSIGVPTYNRSLYLRKSLKFICDAVDVDDLVDIYIYISDNCSEDATQDLMATYEGSCPGLRYYKQTHNVGPTKNFKTIWDKSRGKYVWLLGDDDYILQNIVHDIVDIIMTQGRFSICSLKVSQDNTYF